MEHLSLELRQKVVKMSEARLRQKLVQAGYREVDVAKFDWATLLEYYAKVLLTETAYVPAKEEQEEGEEVASDGEEKNLVLKQILINLCILLVLSVGYRIGLIC